MAVTKIWSVKERLDHAIDYITNKSKTSKETYEKLHNLVEYKDLTHDTEEQYYVTSINCNKETIYEDMIRTKRRYNKEDGIIRISLYSIIQRRRNKSRAST